MANNSLIAKQLEMLAKQIETSADASISVYLLDTCAFLIGSVSDKLKTAQFDEDTNENIFSCTESVSASLEGLADVLKASPDLVPSTETITRLSREKDKARAFREQIALAETELPTVIKENEELTEKAASLEKTIHEQNMLQERLRNALGEYTDERIEAIRLETQNLQKSVAEKAKELQDTEDENTKAHKELDDINIRITNINNDIAAFSDKVKEAAGLLKELEDEKIRCKKAEEDAAADNLQAIRNDIATIGSKADKLEYEVNKLKKEKAEVENSVCRYEKDKAILETSVIDTLLKTMDPLKDIMKDHKDTLNKIKDDAEALKKSLEECKKLRGRYAFMLDNSVSTYEAMAAAAGIDHRQLKETLDITKDSLISKNINLIKEALEKIDKAIAECSKACILDNDKTVMMATSSRK